MKCDITKSSSPKMPELGRGTECLKLLLSQTSKDMNEPLVPIFFPLRFVKIFQIIILFFSPSLSEYLRYVRRGIVYVTGTLRR